MRAGADGFDSQGLPGFCDDYTGELLVRFRVPEPDATGDAVVASMGLAGSRYVAASLRVSRASVTRRSCNQPCSVYTRAWRLRAT